MRLNHTGHCRDRQRGLTLLESLIAIIVLAIGVLSMLGIQMRTLAETQTGVRRAQAVRLVEDLSERLKANPQGLDHLDGYTAGWEDTAVASDCLVAPAGCTPANLAALDLKDWRTSVARTLPRGQAATFVASTTADTGARRLLGVMVGWRAHEHDAASSNSAYTSAFSTDISAEADAGVSAQECPTGLICHLVFIQP